MGCVLGATGVLLYLQETSQLAIAAEPSAAAPVSAAGGGTAVIPTDPRIPRYARNDGDVLIPVAGITASGLRSTFHERRGSRVHGAIDILAPRGTPVVAAVDGTVRKLFNSKAGGLTIYQYDAGEQMVYYYAHLDRYADGVREGLTVKKGDVIGFVGTTGNAPPNTPHLHFQVMRSDANYWNGTPIDVRGFITKPGRMRN